MHNTGDVPDSGWLVIALTAPLPHGEGGGVERVLDQGGVWVLNKISLNLRYLFVTCKNVKHRNNCTRKYLLTDLAWQTLQKDLRQNQPKDQL